VTRPHPAVTYADPVPNGLAAMLGELISQNLARDPRRDRWLRPAAVTLAASDAQVAVTLRIGRDGVEVVNGSEPGADLRVVTDGHLLLDLAAVPLRLGLPDPFTPEGRAVTGALLGRRLRVRGLLAHPLRVMRLNLLLSAAPGQKAGQKPRQKPGQNAGHNARQNAR
jgi:hypothetical protein